MALVASSAWYCGMRLYMAENQLSKDAHVMTGVEIGEAYEKRW